MSEVDLKKKEGEIILQWLGKEDYLVDPIINGACPHWFFLTSWSGLSLQNRCIVHVLFLKMKNIITNNLYFRL